MHEIKDYFVIGDLHSAALISKNGSIDWLCLPHFDSPSIFAKLLDKKAGSFSVDSKGYSVTSQYRENTAIIEFKFKNKYSEYILDDFMVPQPKNTCDTHFLVRKFKGIHGKSDIKLFFEPKANYGKEVFSEEKSLQNEVTSFPKDVPIEPGIILNTGKEKIILFVPKDATIELQDNQYVICFSLIEGETKSLVFEYTDELNKSIYRGHELEKETEHFWKAWVAKGKIFDFYKKPLIRSAITLKLMQFYPTGALVASPTTSLPEEIGGTRNWDYRYVWIRDATFTLYAFSVLGYREEAEKFFGFIQTITEKLSKDNFDVSLMYTITGDPVPNEQTLDYLSGYKNSKPVRIGNGAKDQFQLDVYGALIDSYYFTFKHNKEKKKLHTEYIVKLIHKIEQLWQKQDRGIWEVRTGDRHFTYSKVMAWVGADRGARLFEMMNRDKDALVCKELASEIKEWIWNNCYDKKRQVFKQHPETQNQDATNFLFVQLQFLNKHDPTTRVIIENTCKELSFKDVFVYRYLTGDGLPRGEGAFLLCTFWMISAWAILEDTKKATNLLGKFEKYLSKNFLLSEEIDANTQEYLGNYPQAFSHLGFIMSAYYIQRYKKRKDK